MNEMGITLPPTPEVVLPDIFFQAIIIYANFLKRVRKMIYVLLISITLVVLIKLTSQINILVKMNFLNRSLYQGSDAL